MNHTSIVSRQNLRRWRLGALLGAISIATLGAAASFELPPINVSPTQEHHPGKVIWADLVTPDLEGAKRFYGGLFGWTFRDVPTGEKGKTYAVALLAGQPVGGIFHKPMPTGQQRQPAWLTFIAVRDVSEAEKAVLAHGGKVLSPVRTHAKRGRQAVFADPQGAVFAVLQSSSGDPADMLAGPGECIWSSLITSDADGAAAFYQSLFGYEVFNLESINGREHLLLASDGYARASVNPLPADVPKPHPHWLNFVRVVNAKDAAAKAASLGGRVMVEPHSDRHGGMIAVVADPSGAPFGLFEWADTENKEVTK
jgi:predicted enzyme related to lactoylglutathione lyase